MVDILPALDEVVDVNPEETTLIIFKPNESTVSLPVELEDYYNRAEAIDEERLSELQTKAEKYSEIGPGSIIPPLSLQQWLDMITHPDEEPRIFPLYSPYCNKK